MGLKISTAVIWRIPGAMIPTGSTPGVRDAPAFR